MSSEVVVTIRNQTDSRVTIERAFNQSGGLDLNVLVHEAEVQRMRHVESEKKK